MRDIIKIVKCDLCGKEDRNCEPIDYPVLFHTEQTEGKACKQYIDITKIDVCPECKPQILKVHAFGAQGNNKYSIYN